MDLDRLKELLAYDLATGHEAYCVKAVELHGEFARAA
jgi:hypothetical protein